MADQLASRENNNESPGGGKAGRIGLDDESIRLDLPEVERDSVGIPTFVFRDQLSENDRPRADRKTLEVVLLWREAVMSVGHYTEPRVITAGDSLHNDFRVAVEGLPTDRFPLLETSGRDSNGFVVHWTDNMALEVRTEDGAIVDREALARHGKVREVRSDAGPVHFRYRVGLHDRIALQLDEVTFVIQYVSPARLFHAGILRTIDFYFTKIVGLSFITHLFLVLALLLTPIDPTALSDELFNNPNRFARLILQEAKRPEEKKKFELPGAREAAKHKEKEGKLGKRNKEKKDAMASSKGAPKVDPNKREKDRKIALASGIFAALNGGKGRAVSSVFGPGGLGTGINNALGGLRGTVMGDAGGAGGLGSRGVGPGGGGHSLGIGGLGNGGGRGAGGLSRVDLGGRGKRTHSVIPGRTITKGCLTSQAVRRVLNRVTSQARNCYEQELARTPDLEGKVTTAFVIGPTGAVQSSRIAQSTMDNASVEACLLRVINRLRFPPCAGGGVADVTYPWIFKTGGNT